MYAPLANPTADLIATRDTKDRAKAEFWRFQNTLLAVHQREQEVTAKAFARLTPRLKAFALACFMDGYASGRLDERTGRKRSAADRAEEFLRQNAARREMRVWREMRHSGRRRRAGTTRTERAWKRTCRPMDSWGAKRSGIPSRPRRTRPMGSHPRAAPRTRAGS